MAAIDRQSRIAVAGAGSIGCYVGGCLALAGRTVTLLLRPALADAIGRRGLRISDLDGRGSNAAAGSLSSHTEPAAALGRCRSRSADRQERRRRAGMADLIARHARHGRSS